MVFFHVEFLVRIGPVPTDVINVPEGIKVVVAFRAKNAVPEEVVHGFFFGQAFIRCHLVQIQTVHHMNGTDYKVKGITFRDFVFFFRQMRLHPHFDTQQHVVAAQGQVLFKIRGPVEQELLRIGGIFIIPVLRQDDSDAQLCSGVRRLLQCHFRIAGKLTVIVCVKHGLLP